MISTPSYPAWRASRAARAKARIWRRTPRSDRARGLNLPIGLFTADGATHHGVNA